MKKYTTDPQIDQYLNAVRDNLSGWSTEEVDSILEDLREHIDKALQVYDGEPTRMQIQSVLGEMDPPESFAATFEEGEEPAKVSRLAVLGAILLPFGIVAALLLFPVSMMTTGSAQPETAWWQWLLRITILPLGIISPFATTILGLVSISQIRASKGKLIGKPLALIDALFYPILVFDGLLIAFMFVIIANITAGHLALTEALTLSSYLLVIIVDLIIVVIAWLKIR